MERAAGAALRTREIAATDNPRWSDSTLRLTGLGSRFGEAGAAARIRGILAVCHKKNIITEIDQASLDTPFAKETVLPTGQKIAYGHLQRHGFQAIRGAFFGGGL